MFGWAVYKNTSVNKQLLILFIQLYYIIKYKNMRHNGYFFGFQLCKSLRISQNKALVNLIF